MAAIGWEGSVSDSDVVKKAELDQVALVSKSFRSGSVRFSKCQNCGMSHAQLRFPVFLKDISKG